MASIVIDEVRKAFGALEVLHGVSLEVPDGEFVVLVGPSGCGKSTLLRMIAGLEDVNSGEIRIGERIVNDLLPRDRDVAMVFQSYALYPLKNVFENMAFGLRMRKSPKATIDERVSETASTLELGEYLGRLPKELSGGQRQRVAMGRAIVRQPAAFLFDEPLSNLDARLRGQMRVEIKLRHERLRVTSVYVTHDQVEAMTMADRIAVMRDGVIEQFGTPTELYDSPANMFVASFIGSPPINMISGTFRREGEQAWVEGPEALRLPVSGAIEAREGQPVSYGIRPEAVTVGVGSTLTGKVTLIEMMGPHHQVRASVGGQPICLTMERSTPVAAGDELPFSFDPRAAYVFDEQSGRRLSNREA